VIQNREALGDCRRVGGSSSTVAAVLVLEIQFEKRRNIGRTGGVSFEVKSSQERKRKTGAGCEGYV
jgi:hypothetical protein